MKKLGFLLVATVFFVGCRTDLDSLEKTGRIPKLDRTDTLAGIDANKDGVRDDIEKWIKKRWKKDIKKQKAALQYAKMIQLSMNVDLDDENAIRKLDPIESRAVVCMSNSFESRNIKDEQNPHNVRQEIKAYTTNTKKRFKHFMEYTQKSSDLFNGEVISLPEGDTCEK